MSILCDPDCAAGKHTNCTGAGWDDEQELEAPCPCRCHITRHNHFTRDIKQPGLCPACDEYHAIHPPQPAEYHLLTQGIRAVTDWRSEVDPEHHGYLNALHNIMDAARELVATIPGSDHSFDAGPRSQVGLAVALAGSLIGVEAPNDQEHRG